VDTSEVAALFGDETELYADTRDGDLGGVSLAVFVARHLGRGKSGFHRIGMVGVFLATAGHSVQREAEVLVRLGRGRSNPQIAAELQLSRKTVSSHLEHIYTKLGVKPGPRPPCSPCATASSRRPAGPGPDRKIGQLPDSATPRRSVQRTQGNDSPGKTRWDP
jgi:hypothetical protein